MKTSPAAVRRSKTTIFDGKLRVRDLLTSSPKVALLRIVREMVEVETKEL